VIDRLLNRPGPLRKQRAELSLRLRREGKGRDYLDRATGRDAVAWVLFIQEAISSTWEDNPADPDHPISDPRIWAHALVNELWQQRPSRYGDENMWMAAVLAVAAGTWAVRIQRAKAFDPHRPVALRKGAYRRWLGLTRALLAVTVDESRDSEMFDQPWESPFVKDATDGRFV
jgi:hypothetical protein